MSADVRIGTDFYSLNAENKTWAGSRMNNSYNVSQEKFYENNYITSLTAKKDNIVGKWGASLSVYGQMMETKTDAIYLSASKLTIPNYFDINNSDGNPLIQTVKLNKKLILYLLLLKLIMMDTGLSTQQQGMTGLQH